MLSFAEAFAKGRPDQPRDAHGRWVSRGYDPEAAAKKGHEALDQILAGRVHVRAAMHRPEIGAIDFRRGDSSGGIRHIVERHGLGTLRRMPGVIAHGRIRRGTTPQGRARVNIEHQGWTASLATDYHGEPGHWLVTGFGPKVEKSALGEFDSGPLTAGEPTQHGLALDRNMLGARAPMANIGPISRSFNEVLKDMTAGDAHAETALGNQAGRRRRLALSMIGQAPKVVEKDAAGAGPRILKPMADGRTAHSPFPYDAGALANLREDQVPRFFGALTDQDRLPLKTVALDSLTAMQNRVDPAKVEAMRGGKVGKPALVIRSHGRNYIADGHHRLSADLLDGKTEAQVRYLDLTAQSNALKRHAGGPDWSVPLSVAKADPEQRLIFGWASVVEKDGRLVVDKQGDMILPAELERAAYDFVLHSRDGGDMHLRKGCSRLVESIVFTKEKQAAMGIELPGGMVGWWTGFYVDDDELWAAHKRGERPEFSIGGTAHRAPI